jgi:hypothetical protein
VVPVIKRVLVRPSGYVVFGMQAAHGSTSRSCGGGVAESSERILSCNAHTKNTHTRAAHTLTTTTTGASEGRLHALAHLVVCSLNSSAFCSLVRSRGSGMLECRSCSWRTRPLKALPATNHYKDPSRCRHTHHDHLTPTAASFHWEGAMITVYSAARRRSRHSGTREVPTRAQHLLLGV